MNIAKKFAAAAPFAHLLGMAAHAKSGKAETPDEDDKKKSRRAEEDDEKKDDAPESRADSEDDDVDADESDDQDDSEKKDSKKSKKAKKAKADDVDGEEDPDAEDEGSDEDESAKAARKAERARCKAIFTSQAAGARPDVAAHLAFNTNMSSKAAVAMLEAVAAVGTPRKAGLADRMANVKTANVGADGGNTPAPGSPQAAAQAIISAGKKARGEA